jgi:hypothetical protein
MGCRGCGFWRNTCSEENAPSRWARAARKASGSVFTASSVPINLLARSRRHDDISPTDVTIHALISVQRPTLPASDVNRELANRSA